jgi:regulator of replication initiation timing
MKTLKRILLLTLLLSVVMVMSISVMPIAYAEGEIAEEIAEPTAEPVEESEETSLMDTLVDWKVKIIAFIGGLTVTNVLALLILFIKARGKNMTLKEAFNSIKTKLSTTENNASLLQLENAKLKETMEKFPTVEQLFKGVSTDIENLVADTIKKVIADSNTVSNNTLGNTEVISAQLANVAKALSVAFKDNDKVLSILANSPSTMAVDKLAKTVALLQDYVAQKTGTDSKELQAYIEKSISEVQNG